jgi:glycosyltransferase involved in cell wall biosynthesis
MNNTNKISVIIICYNQEDVISRSIESVLYQKDYLHELIIADDCSTDNTWIVVKKYANKYPNKVKPYRNEVNLGMYENLQNSYKYVTGNLILFLAGDDAFGIELFSEIINLVDKKSLDANFDKFTIITDYKIEYPNGKEITYSNNKLESKKNPFSLKIRGLVVARAMCESKSVFLNRKQKFITRKPGSKFPSYLQEGYTDAFPFAFSDQILYLPYIGNIYYADIGHLKKIIHKKNETLSRYENYSHDFIEIFSTKLTQNDVRYLRFVDVKFKYLITRNLKTWFKYLFGVTSLILDPFSSKLLIKELIIFSKLTINPNKF